MVEKFTITTEQHRCINRRLLEIQQQVCVKSGGALDPELVANALQCIIEGKFENNKGENKILNLLSWDDVVVVGPCDGRGTLSTVASFGASAKNIATKETTVAVYGLIKDATFAEMFGSLGVNLEKLCMTQHQIKELFTQYSELLCLDGGKVFFLIKLDDDFFVVVMTRFSHGLSRFDSGNLWKSKISYRIVVPQ